MGDLAKLRFTATNNRDTEAERLLFITTDAGAAVHISPDTRSEIPPNSSITTGQNGRASLDVEIEG